MATILAAQDSENGRPVIPQRKILHGLAAAGLIGLMAGVSTEADAGSASATRVVRDPVTGQVRVVNPALDPLDPFPMEKPSLQQAPIKLHMPRPRPPSKPKVARSVPVEAPAEASVEAPAPPAKPAPVKASVQKQAAKSAAGAPDQGSAIPFSFGGPQAAAPAKGAREAKAAPPPAQTAAPPTTARTVHINFASGATEPSSQVASALKSMAGNFTTDLATSSDRILLEAYAGAPGDKSSDARRLSLKRALSVRQLLIDSGVPSDRIDVRALGGADSGTADRVDLMLRG